MSSPTLGDSPSLHERPGLEQINLKHMPLEKHSTSPPTNTRTDPNPVVPGDGGHVMRAQGCHYHHPFPRGEYCSEKGRGPEFFQNGEDPGSPYETFASGSQFKPLRGPGHGTSPTQKPRRRRQARKPTQPTKGPQSSGKIQKTQSERSKRDSNASITASGRQVTPGMQNALQLYQKQLGLLEAQNKRRLEASQGEPSEKRI